MTRQDLYGHLAASAYSARFRAILRFVLEWEIVTNKAGVILVEDDPDDAGGRTFCGLDARSHPTLNFAKLTEADVCRAYYADYWQRYNCEARPSKLGEVYFNAAVNCGNGRATKLLAACGNKAGAFLDEQEAFYRRLAAQRPPLKKFLRGWLNRTSALRRHLGL